MVINKGRFVVVEARRVEIVLVVEEEPMEEKKESDQAERIPSHEPLALAQ